MQRIRLIGARFGGLLLAGMVAILLHTILMVSLNGAQSNDKTAALVGEWGIAQAHAAPLANDGDDDSDDLDDDHDDNSDINDSDDVDDAEDEGDDDYSHYLEFVKEMPEGKIGLWVVGTKSFTVTSVTELEGPIIVGSCVEVKSEEHEPTVAAKIVHKDEKQCDPNDDDQGDAQDDDGKEDSGKDNDWDDDEWEGSIVSFPEALIGQWVISLGESKQFTFTTDAQTRFDAEKSGGFAVGQWVEVDLRQAPMGQRIADRVRIDDFERGEIVVRLASPIYSTTIAAKYDLVLTSTLLTQANIYLYMTTDGDEQRIAAEIAQEEGVIWAEVNYVNRVPEEDGYKTWGWGGVSEPDTYFGQSAYSQIRWNNNSKSYKGEGIVVAVLDTGIYTAHEQFVGKLQLPSLDVIGDDNDPSEEGPGLAWGHGTHVAGVIAAMAPDAKILPVRVLDANGRGNTFLLAYAIEWVSRQPDVRVINLSLGTPFDSKILRDVVNAAIDRGIIVVAAAGNNGSTQIQYPAGYENVIAVTAVDAGSHKALFANYGSNWVDIAAPGVSIMSTMINADGPGYATWSGTSMSTAFVSGAAVLAASKWQVFATTPQRLIEQIVMTGQSLDNWDPTYGGQIGRLLDISAVLGVDASLLYMPASQK